MIIFGTSKIYDYIPKNSKKKDKKKKERKTIFELNYIPENAKEIQKTVFI